MEDDNDNSTNGTGSFSTALPLGQYVIQGIATPFGIEEMDDSQVTNDSSTVFTISTTGMITKLIDLGGDSVKTGS